MSGPTSSSVAELLRPQLVRAKLTHVLVSRMARLRRYGWHVAQCAVASWLSWVLAHELLGHQQPLFAPIAAIVALGLSYGQRLRRVAEVTAGVSVGVLIGDLFVSAFGVGGWQVLVVVALAMTSAVLLNAGPLLITQAGIQSAILATLAPDAQAGLGRWLDALCGGLLALLAAAVVSGAPLRRPRLAAAHVARELAVWLHEAAEAARRSELDRAYRTLDRARHSEPALDDLRLAVSEGLDVAQSSPWRRRHRDDVRAVAYLTVLLDRAVRNVRVLLRRTVEVIRRGERLPDETLALLDGLADAATIIARELDSQQTPRRASRKLQKVGAASYLVPTGQSLSADVVLAQTRSVVVDLLQLSGHDIDSAEPLDGEDDDSPDDDTPR